MLRSRPLSARDFYFFIIFFLPIHITFVLLTISLYLSFPHTRATLIYFSHFNQRILIEQRCDFVFKYYIIYFLLVATTDS